MIRDRNALDADHATFYDRLFKRDGVPDLHLSVYVLPPPGWDASRLSEAELTVRAMVEHAATNLNPPSLLYAVDVRSALDGTEPLVQTPLTGPTQPFAFIDRAHHEIRFRDETHLAAFVGRLYRSVQASRRDPDRTTAPLIRLRRDELAAYAARHLDPDDPEWAACLAADPGRAQSWRRISRQSQANSR